MILFVPFRNEAGLILDGKTVEEAFQHHRNDNDSLNMHHEKLQKLLGAEKKWKEIQDTRKSIGLGEAEEPELKNRDDNETQLLGEIMDAVNDIADMNNVANLTLDQRVAMLNSDQKRIYDKIRQHLTKQKQKVTMMSKLMTFNLYTCLLRWPSTGQHCCMQHVALWVLKVSCCMQLKILLHKS